MLKQARGKASLVLHMRNYAVQTYGQQAWSTVVERASREDREVLSGMLLAGGWVPIGVVNRAVTTLLAEHRTRDDEMRKLSAFIADNDLGTVYKMALRFGSPEFLLSRTGSLWNRYFDSGTLTPKDMGPRHWRLTLDAPVGDDVAPNQLFCGPGCPAWIEMGLRLTGATNASVRHTECRYSNGSSCSYVVTW